MNGYYWGTVLTILAVSVFVFIINELSSSAFHFHYRPKKGVDLGTTVRVSLMRILHTNFKLSKYLSFYLIVNIFAIFTTQSFILKLDHYLSNIILVMSKGTIINRHLEFHNSAPCNYILKNEKIIPFSPQSLMSKSPYLILSFTNKYLLLFSIIFIPLGDSLFPPRIIELWIYCITRNPIALNPWYSRKYYVQSNWGIRLYNVTTYSSVDLFMFVFCF